MDGVLVVDKPGGMTSRDVVDAVQRWFPRRTRIGHTGTLDPLATGVLVLCVGAATKVADRIQALGKTYETRIRLGATSDTDDADGTITATPDTTPCSEADIRANLPAFVGEIQQLPPPYSALKVNGRRAYALARKGKPVNLIPRPVTVTDIQLLRFAWPYLDLRIDCGKGTYIRSIARDLGAALGVGGMVQTLRRTRVGPYLAEHGIGLDASVAQAWARVQPAPF